MLSPFLRVRTKLNVDRGIDGLPAFEPQTSNDRRLVGGASAGGPRAAPAYADAVGCSPHVPSRILQLVSGVLALRCPPIRDGPPMTIVKRKATRPHKSSPNAPKGRQHAAYGAERRPAHPSAPCHSERW